MKFGTPVFVSWIDSAGPASGWVFHEDQPLEPIECITAGLSGQQGQTLRDGDLQPHARGTGLLSDLHPTVRHNGHAQAGVQEGQEEADDSAEEHRGLVTMDQDAILHRLTLQGANLTGTILERSGTESLVTPDQSRPYRHCQSSTETHRQ